MYWEESGQPQAIETAHDVVDAAFTISCRTLPVDHAFALSRALLEVLPWLQEEALAGVHPLHVAESGNGWMRPEGPDALLYPSRRTRLVLRLPSHRIEDARALVGGRLQVRGHALSVGQMTVRPLHAHPAVFSRHVALAAGADEVRFLDEAAAALAALGIRPRKMLCGRESAISLPQGPMSTRSLMLAELDAGESIELQRRGLGPYRHLGCGLFVPHKDIRDVRRPGTGSG